MNYKAFGAIFVLLMMASCSYSPKENIQPKRSIVMDSLTLCETMDKLPHKVRFVKLETNNDCILNDIKKIEIDDEDIFVEDYQEKIFHFDKDGQFLNVIGSKGGAHHEYVSIFDFYLNKKERVAQVVDFSKGKILCYDYNGKFKSSRDIDPQLLPSAAAIIPVNNNLLIGVNCNGPGEEYQYTIVDLQKKTATPLLPFVVIGKERSMQDVGKVACNSSTIYLLSFLSDTIYTYSEHGITCEYLFQPHEPHFSINDIKDETFITCYDAKRYGIKKSMSVGINAMYATDTHLFFTYTTQENNYRIFYNTETQTGYKFDVMSKLDDVGNVIWNNVVAGSGRYFIGVLPVGEYISNESLRTQYPELSNLFDKSAESDNPIIAFVEVQN